MGVLSPDERTLYFVTDADGTLDIMRQSPIQSGPVSVSAGFGDAAWPELRPRYGEGFYRMWQYYLMVSAAAFRSRSLQLQQFVFTRQGTKQPAVRQS